MLSATPASVDATDGPSAVDLVASCLVLFTIAVAQPMLDLLGRNPEFFVTHRIGGGELVLLVIACTILVPLLLGGVAVFATRLYRGAGMAIHGVILFTLAGVLTVVMLKRAPLDAIPWWLHVLAAAAVAGVVLVAFHRSTNLRWVMRIGVVIPVVLLGLLLLASRTAALVVTPQTAATGAVAFPADAPPTVLVMFDELPLASLIDGHGELQSEVYPNFARLAAVST